MRHSKKILAAVAAVSVLTGLAACGSSGEASSKGDANKAELVFWGWDSGNSMKDLIAEFEKANPGITVKFNNTVLHPTLRLLLQMLLQRVTELRMLLCSKTQQLPNLQ